MDEFGITDGVDVNLEKRIPVAAGMAGGSSDAASVLYGMNKMFSLGLSRDELMRRGVKIGADVPDQVILGACSPAHAYRAIQAEPTIGLLLPCNVVVRSDGSETIVDVIDPQMMVKLSDSSSMCAVADEIEGKLRATVAAVNAAF